MDVTLSMLKRKKVFQFRETQQLFQLVLLLFEANFSLLIAIKRHEIVDTSMRNNYDYFVF